MSLSNAEVLRRFREHRKGNGGNVSTDGERFYSYSAVIAQWLGAEDNLEDKAAIAIINGDRLSNTSSQHLGMFRTSSEPVVSFSALSAAGLSRGQGWRQGPLYDGVQLVDFKPSLYVTVYEGEADYETVLNQVPIGATTFEKAGSNYTITEQYCHYGYEAGWDDLKCPGSYYGACRYCPDTRQRQVVKRNRGYRGYHRAGAVVLRYRGYDYLCGFDEGSYFVSKLPMLVKTVEGAFKVLMPKGVNGQKFLRQGEWFFVEAPQDVLESLAAQSRRDIADAYNELTGSARFPFLLPFLPGMEKTRRYYTRRAREIAGGMGPKYTFSGFKRVSSTQELPRARGSNPHTVTYLHDDGVLLLAAGTVRHPQHRMLKLEPGKVYIVYRNMSLGDWSSDGRVD
jgi:hypothetical protein